MSEGTDIPDIVGNCIILIVSSQRPAKLIDQNSDREMPIFFQPDIEFLEFACDLLSGTLHFHQKLPSIFSLQ